MSSYKTVDYGLLEEVRATLNSALGDKRFDRLDAHDVLIQSGLISSLEMIFAASALENKFNISIQSSAITVSNFATLGALANMVAGHISGEDYKYKFITFQSTIFNSLKRSLKPTVLMIVLVAAFLIGLDFGLYLLVNGPLSEKYNEFHESGHRLYPSAGTYAHDDYVFAVSQHEIVNYKGIKSPRIAVFGDSGTIGSWVRYDESPTMYTETALRDTYPQAEVFNLAYFATVIIKDFMILEAIIEKSEGKIPFDVAVFTISDRYYEKKFQRNQFDYYFHIPFNRELFERFTERFNRGNKLPYESIANDLSEAYKRHITKPKYHRLLPNILNHWLGRHSSLIHYGPFLREYFYKYTMSKIAITFGSLNIEKTYEIGRQQLYSVTPDIIPESFIMHDKGIRKDDIDEGMIKILKDVIYKLQSRNVRVILFAKPIAPKKWRYKMQDFKDVTAIEIARKICAEYGCEIADFRWALQGNHFSDDVSHYNVDGNRILGEKLARVIKETLNK